MQHGPSAFVMERQARATNHRLDSQINEMRVNQCAAVNPKARLMSAMGH